MEHRIKFKEILINCRNRAINHNIKVEKDICKVLHVKKKNKNWLDSAAPNNWVVRLDHGLNMKLSLKKANNNFGGDGDTTIQLSAVGVKWNIVSSVSHHVKRDYRNWGGCRGK